MCRPDRLALALSAALLLGAPGPGSLLPGTLSLAAQAAPPAKVAASLKRVFGRVERVDSVAVDSAVVLRAWSGDSLLGLAQVRNVKGKDQPITYLVATDADLRLRDVDILVYREAYGGEVAYEAWRKQFRGRGPEDPLEVGRDIRSISGATISVNAVTLGVRRTLADLVEWRKAGRL
jgi:Na+-translocating ferredoxin:NAD+ oxidoreductase RnfG subunit